MKTIKIDEWMSADETREYLGLSRQRVYAMAKSGKLKFMLLGNKYFFYRPSVELRKKNFSKE